MQSEEKPPAGVARGGCPRWFRAEWVVVGAITLVAAFLRVYRLDALPPGVHFDEAVYGLQGQYIYQGHFPVFFPGYTGREPLYMYLVALVYLFTRPGTFGLRLTSALIGVATVPAAYLAFREMFGRRVAALGALLTAISFWHLNVTRTGFCWTLMPLAEAVAIYLLWRGYTGGRLWLLAAGGAAVAANLYIYLAARFFPVTLLFVFFYLLIVDRQGVRARWRGLLLAAAVAVVVFAPLGIHYLRFPHDFWERADQVLAWKQAGARSYLGLIADNLAHVPVTFLPRQDTAGRYSLQGRPAFDLLIGPFFLLGVGLALWRWKRPQYGIMVLWWLVMALPPVFTIEPYPVSNQRIFGTIPAIYGLAALGMDAVWGWAARRRVLRVVVPVGLGLVVVVEGTWNGLYYFARWAPSAEAYAKFHSDVVELARHVAPEMEAGHRVVIASEHWHHPSMVITDPVTLNAKWVQGRKTVALPAWDGREIDYLVPILDAAPISPAYDLLGSLASRKETLYNALGQPVVDLYRISQPPAIESSAKPLATYSDEVALWSIDVPATAPRGRPLRVGLHWQVLKSVNAARGFAVHLVDMQGTLWAQADELGYIPPEWQPGDNVWQWLDVELPDTIPPGSYQVQVILDDAAAKPLPVRNAQGVLSGVYVSGGPVKLTPDKRLVEPASSGAPVLGPLRVRSWQPVDVERRPGESVLVDVTWQAAAPATAPLSAELELRAPDGHAVLHWTFPLAMEYPASLWQIGEVVRQRYLLPLAPDAPAGEYSVTLGVSGQAGSVVLGKVRVAGVARLMVPPPMQRPLPSPIGLGGKAELLGYDVQSPVKASEPFELTLYWRALDQMDTSYAVFVHILDERGEIVAQRDVAPADGSRPTTGWLSGEVVADRHLFPAGKLAPGRYRIAVGMYHPATLQRLEMRTATGERVPDDRFILPEEIEVR